MKMIARLFVALAMFVAAVPASADDVSPARAARVFYDLYLQVQPRGIPEVAVRARFEPLVTPELLSKLAQAQAVEKKHFIATKNQEPPLFQGDPFSSLFEGATSYKLGQCVTEGARSYCDIDLTYAEPTDNKPTTWTDKLILVKRVGGWKVDDISFGATWDFGQHGTLRGTLGDVIRAGTE
tara:strand:+ start:333 stop:875 length:543 start_codon:yes stop_codon:yes gene_type:complete